MSPARIRAAALAAATLLLIGGCSAGTSSFAPSDAPSDTPGPPRPAAGAAGYTLKIAMGEDFTTSRIDYRLVQAWNDSRKQHPERPRAEVVELTSDSDPEHAELAAEGQLGSSALDVVSLDVTWIPEFVKAGLVHQLPNRMLDGMIPVVRQSGQDEKHRTWAVPFRTDVGLLYYRKDQLGPAPSGGWTWQQINHLLSGNQAKFKDRYATQLKQYEGLTVNALESVAGDLNAAPGPVLTGKDGQASISGDTSKAVVKGLVDLWTDVNYTWDNKSSLSMDEASSQAAFTAGQALFMRNWPYAYEAMDSRKNQKGSAAEFRAGTAYGVTALPGATVLGGWDLAVAKNSPHAYWAQQLIAFLTSPTSQDCLLQGGNPPVLASSYDDNQRRPCPAAVYSAPPDAGLVPIATTIKDQLDRAVLRPRTPYYSDFSQTLQAEATRVLRAPSRGAAERIAEQVPAKLRAALTGH
ncbi:hypothetical protein BIV57_06310 [Mangrovactinospora gilvigrisea]|uniref:ABC transporter substrate-binding protein n=1 Tax=Mangrovactinospora gilvigrisea TaxID=1428644 RepID=A0A1J7BI01_9ACTN|nr:extracellular solute-binding protein [Mangrovactinospora gilvigrisea]OIV38278.1 hypothetical protein BIV57_06310 [Mangrovactinospora gilvigrisea]